MDAGEGTSAAKAKPIRFYPALDIFLLREMVARQPSSKVGWDTLHKNVNAALQQTNLNNYVTLRACKDRVRTLQEAHRKDEMNSLRA
jgi:hypothetical protein